MSSGFSCYLDFLLAYVSVRIMFHLLLAKKSKLLHRVLVLSPWTNSLFHSMLCLPVDLKRARDR